MLAVMRRFRNGPTFAQCMPTIDVKGQKSREKNGDNLAANEAPRIPFEQPGERRLRIAEDARHEPQNGGNEQAAAKHRQWEKWIPGTWGIRHETMMPGRG